MYSGMPPSLWDDAGRTARPILRRYDRGGGQADAVPAQLLGAVQGEVRGGEQVEQVVAVQVEDGDTGGDRHGDRRLLGGDDHPADLRAQPFGDPPRLVQVGAG